MEGTYGRGRARRKMEFGLMGKKRNTEQRDELAMKIGDAFNSQHFALRMLTSG